KHLKPSMMGHFQNSGKLPSLLIFLLLVFFVVLELFLILLLTQALLFQDQYLATIYEQLPHPYLHEKHCHISHKMIDTLSQITIVFSQVAYYQSLLQRKQQNTKFPPALVVTYI